MLIPLHVKYNKDHRMTIQDFKMNKNAEINLINIDHIREITPFDEREINRMPFGYLNYLYGSKSTVWFSYISYLHVVESLEEIQHKIAVATGVTR